MSTLLRFDPVGDFDRLLDQVSIQRRRPSFPMDAYRHGDTVVAHFDLPGVDPSSISLEYERQMLTVTAERSWRPVQGDQVLAAERLHGRFHRQILLGDGLDADKIHASYENGVLTVTVPIAERAKPRRIVVAASGSTPEGAAPAIDATAV